MFTNYIQIYFSAAVAIPTRRITLATDTETELYSEKETRNRKKSKTITNNGKLIVFGK